MVVASLALALLGMTPGKIDINLKDLKDGDTISRPRTLTVTASSSAGSTINQVEFYVNDKLRSSDTSTPYEFQIDPLNEAGGKLTLTFAAYSSDGENAKKTVTVTIDAGSSRGAQANVDAGYEALAKGDLDGAIYSGRIALQTTAGFNPARILLARAYLRKGEYDKAQTFAEDALTADPNLDDANEVLSGIGLRKAFSTLSSGNRKETLASIKSALDKGVAARRRVLDRQFDAAGTPTAANLVKWATTAIRAGRYNAAVNALTPVWQKKASDAQIGNLLAYAQIRNADYIGASYTVSEMDRVKALDGYGYALKSLLFALQGKDNDSDSAMSEAVGNDPDNLGVKVTQTYIALKRNRIAAVASMVKNLVKDDSQRPEVNYYLSILLNNTQSYVEADKRFMDALLAEPTLVDMLVERGNQSVMPLISKPVSTNDPKLELQQKEFREYQIDLAGAYYKAALTAKPDSAQALTAMMIYYSAIGKTSDALSYADAAIAAGATYPAAHLAGAMVYAAVQFQLGDRVVRIRKDAKGALTSDELAEISKLESQSLDLSKKADAARRKSAGLDPTYLDGQFSPNLTVVYAYFVRHGRIPLLTMP